MANGHSPEGYSRHYHWWNGLRGLVFNTKATYRAGTYMYDPRQNGHSLEDCLYVQTMME